MHRIAREKSDEFGGKGSAFFAERLGHSGRSAASKRRIVQGKTLWIRYCCDVIDYHPVTVWLVVGVDLLVRKGLSLYGIV